VPDFSSVATPTPLIGRLVVVGLGLIGGSFAKGVRESGLCGEVVGLDLDPQSRKLAVELGVVDRCEEDLAAACQGADVIQLAVPILAMEKLLGMLARLDLGDAILTDVGSAKGNVVRAAREVLAPRQLLNFVPGHPIAGRETNGPDAAIDHLYIGKKAVITALDENSDADIERVAAAWRACGAIIHRLTPEEHDKVFAAVSHLPHLLAYALVDDIANKPHADLLFQYAASGFRDFTRIAGSSPEMWRDISLANQPALLAELDAYMAQLTSLRAHLAANDGVALERIYSNAQQARHQWITAIEAAEAPPSPDKAE